MPPFKDENVLVSVLRPAVSCTTPINIPALKIIAPGSQTTEAQLGLPESFTPPKWRFPTRMFPGENAGEWEPLKVRTRIKTVPAAANGETTTNGQHTEQPDVEMKDANGTDGAAGTTGAGSAGDAGDAGNTEGEALTSEPQEETTEIYEDDPLSSEGAVYPIEQGRIENWSCFFAFLSHIYNMISPPPFHMPVLVVSQPCWSARDHELITQYFFENWRIPAFCLMDAALTACYAYGVPTALVVDVGLDKCDVTAVTDFLVNDMGRGVAISGCGGRTMTNNLHRTLQSQGFSKDMAEQLKKSPICEILPVGTPLPRAATSADGPHPAAAMSLDSGTKAKDGDGVRPGQAPRGLALGMELGEEGNGEDDDNEGVLDVAAIVARDNAAELLAKREQEKAARAAAKKGAAAEGLKPIRLKNSEKERATFVYEDYLHYDHETNGDGPIRTRKRKREIEVGVERFMAVSPGPGATDGILDTIASAIHHTILSVPEIPQRSHLWENLIIIGNGSRIRGVSAAGHQSSLDFLLTGLGFKSALLSILASRYTLSPSTATIFTSELPSNFTTPVATPGTNTPIPGQAMHNPAGHGVNPLLVAATKNMMQPNQHLQVPGQLPMMDPSMHHSHRGFSQTPTLIKTVKVPEYFPEWKDPNYSGMEEAAFLGAQVAAKVVYIVDQGNSKGFLTRSEYNDLGPAGIHECAM